MPPLNKQLRNQLETATRDARRIAERGARSALEALTVHEGKAGAHLDAGKKALRNRLRAHARQLGDRRDQKTRRQAIERLTREGAYEHWHRMLFARFLAENDLLIHPEHNVSMSLEDVEELAREEGIDQWELASRYAQRMLPQIFRPDDPVLAVELPRERRLELEQLLESLPAETFTASDSLGWTYQFWQSAEKDAVNASGNKIGADELPAVTQLFTEPYMVRFLIHNTLGAWWAGKQLPSPPGRGAGGEGRSTKDALKNPHPSPLPRGEGAGSPLPGGEGGSATGYRPLPPLNIACSGIAPQATKEDWLKLADKSSKAWEAIPKHAHEFIRNGLLDLHEQFSQAPTLGSLIDPTERQSDLITADFETLRPFLDAVLAAETDDDETHERAIAARGMAKAADILGGQFPSPPGRGVRGEGESASDDRKNPHPRPLSQGERGEEDPHPSPLPRGEGAGKPLPEGEGVSDGYHLVITNVPYLGRGKQSDPLKKHLETYYKNAKADLATAFVLRALKACSTGGTTALVTPQNWLFLTTYKKLREHLLKQQEWNLVARLGPKGFQTPMWDFNIQLGIITASKAAADHRMAGTDVSDAAKPAEKAQLLRGISPLLLFPGLGERPGVRAHSPPLPLGEGPGVRVNSNPAATAMAGLPASSGVSGGSPEGRGDVPEAFGDSPEACGDSPETGGDGPGKRGGSPEGRGETPESAGDAPQHAGESPAPSGDHPEGKKDDSQSSAGHATPPQGAITLVPQQEQLKNPDARVTLNPTNESTLVGEFARALQGVKTGDDERFRRFNWEVSGDDWPFFQTTVDSTTHWGGLLYRIDMRYGTNAWARPQGKGAWGKAGVAVSQMSSLPVAVYSGAVFDSNMTPIVPRKSEHVPAVWVMASHDDFAATVRSFDQSLKVPNASFEKVPFDLDHWQKVAAEKYPDGLPEPESDDPTQWLFHGRPDEATPGSELQVAVARLLGYRWPAELEDPHPGPLPRGEGGESPSPSGRGVRGEGETAQSFLPRDILEHVRELRQNQTDAEQLMWGLLRDRRFLGLKFRRQHPIDHSIVDFYCHEKTLAIELDGGQHNEADRKDRDEQRSQQLSQKHGVRVLRFWNHDVLRDTESVLEAIYNAVQEDPHPNPLPGGEGTRGPHPNPLPGGEGTRDPHPRPLFPGERGEKSPHPGPLPPPDKGEGGRMRLSDRARSLVARCAELDEYVDDDGIVCLSSVRGESPAADRLRRLLGAAFGEAWSAGKEQELLQAAADAHSKGKAAGSLEEWLRDRFFEEHCALFHRRPFIWHIWDGRKDGFNALVNYHKLAGADGQGKQALETLTYAYLNDWINTQKRQVESGAAGSEARLAAAIKLQEELRKILEGEPPYDLFIRWKPLREQPIGWDPDINDGVRLNIRPFLMAKDLGKRDAGILKCKPDNTWSNKKKPGVKDRGKEPKSLRPRDEFPWFWGCDPEKHPEHRKDFGAPLRNAPPAGDTCTGARWNGLHYTNEAKKAARERAAEVTP